MLLKRFTLSQTPTQPPTLTNNNPSLSKKVDYYTEIQHNFLQLFEQKYLTKEHSIKPLLVAWGYYADSTDLNHESIVDRAIAIERIYQASKSLDTNSEAVSIINKSIPILKEKNYWKNFIDIHDLENITNQILHGKTKFDFDLIELLKSTAEKLLSNCFFLGYHLSDTEYQHSDTAIEICRIGNLSEYCFHALDNLSLFSSYDKSLINQENTIIRYLYGASSRKERKLLDSNFDIEYVNKIIHKHKITNLVLEDINMKMSFVKKSITNLQEANPDYYADFSRFLNETFKIHFQKCGLTYEDMF